MGIAIFSSTYIILDGMQEWNESPVLISVDSLGNRLKDIEFPAVTLCPDFPPDHAALAEQVFNLFKIDCNIDDPDYWDSECAR